MSAKSPWRSSWPSPPSRRSSPEASSKTIEKSPVRVPSPAAPKSVSSQPWASSRPRPRRRAAIRCRPHPADVVPAGGRVVRGDGIAREAVDAHLARQPGAGAATLAGHAAAVADRPIVTDTAEPLVRRADGVADAWVVAGAEENEVEAGAATVRGAAAGGDAERVTRRAGTSDRHVLAPRAARDLVVGERKPCAPRYRPHEARSCPAVREDETRPIRGFPALGTEGRPAPGQSLRAAAIPLGLGRSRTDRPCRERSPVLPFRRRGRGGRDR